MTDSSAKPASNQIGIYSQRNPHSQSERLFVSEELHTPDAWGRENVL